MEWRRLSRPLKSDKALRDKFYFIEEIESSLWEQIWNFKLIELFFVRIYFMCMDVLSACMSVIYTYAVTPRGQMRVLDPLGLVTEGLCSVGARNPSWVLGESSQCS